MPKAMEMALKKSAKKKGMSKKRAGAYIYGTMRKAGWKSSREKGSSEEIKSMREHGKKRGL